MTKVYSKDLVKASKKMKEHLEKLASSSRELAKEITGFSDNPKNKIEGNGWTHVIEKLSLYTSALSAQADLCDSLVEYIQSANNQMLNYMEGYTKLNDKDKGEISSRIDQCNRDIDKLWAKHFEGEKINYSLLYQYQNDLVELRKYYKKIKDLVNTDENIFDTLTDATDAMNKFRSRVNHINVTSA